MWAELRNWVLLCVLAVSAFASACSPRSSGPEDPKKRLNEYISRSFAVKRVEERAELLSYLTGQAKARLAAWSDEQFRQAFIDSKREFVRMVFTEVKAASPNEVNVTYELTYIDQSRGSGAKVTQKKLGQLINENGHWLIRDVTNIKELVEYKNEMSLP
ncbi:MAG: hypothetical protein NDJ89_05945 [Oligoflexia bacterium]|nr:hypothetical protein [Oligoflexia bacterium]